MATYHKTELVLVAKHDNGSFLYLECSPGATTPHYIKNPINATYIRPYSKSDEIHNASYYFENSARMRDWLKDCIMVIMEIRTEALIS